MFFKKIKHQNLKDEFDESNCKKLTRYFIEEKFNDAVQQAEKYFIKSYKGTYNQFIEEVKSTQKTNCCLFSWNKPTLSGVCIDCQNTESTCLCISCFLAKHHEEHQSYIKYFSSGNCDCGDPSFIKPSGFCPNHPGPDPNPDITQMTPETRMKFITVFRAAFTAIFLYSPYAKSNKEKSKAERYKRPTKIIDYIKSFIPYGDGIRRCASYGIVCVAKEHLTNFLEKGDGGLTENILNLFGLLISDTYFRDRMSIISFRDYNRLFNQYATCIYNQKGSSGKKCSLKQYFHFTYHFFSEHSILYALNKESFEWPGFLNSYICNILCPIELTNYDHDLIFEEGILDHFGLVLKFLKLVVRFDEEYESIQQFIDSYSRFLYENESKLGFIVKTTPEDESDLGYISYYLTYFLSEISNTFLCNSKYLSPQNTTFSLNKTFENLIEFLERKDIKPESVLNSQDFCVISTMIMLHNLFFILLIGQKKPKEELKSLCQKRRYDFNYFCSIVIVYPLRVIATLFSFSKFANLNNGNRTNIRHLIIKSEVTFNQMFGLVQLILSICDNKSKVMNSILTTFGVFDDISLYEGKLDENEYSRQKFLFDDANRDCSIFLLSILTDNNVLKFDNIKFKRLRIIELLKRKKATAQEIEEYVDEKLSNQIFADELLDYIERVTRKKGGSYFRIKNDGDFNPFFPAILQMDRIALLAKYKDQLIPLTEGFEDNERGMNLKECFKTPEFFCLCFNLLSTAENDLIKKQVGLAMCNCFIKNAGQFPPESYKDNNPINISASTLQELIKNVKESDEMKKANWLTVKLQIDNDKKEKMSMVKLILLQENLGQLLIEKTGLPVEIELSEAQKKQQEEKERMEKIIKEKKAKAAQLKQRLMKDFQNRRKQFTNLSSSDIKVDEKPEQKKPDQNNVESEDETDEDFDSNQHILTDESNNILCHICISHQDDIFGVPCLSVPSILYSLVNDKVHRLNTPLQNHTITYSMNICPHYLHYKCYVKVLTEAGNAKFFHCMTDRGIRNCFLPVFDQIKGKDDDEENDQFIQQPPVMMRVAITDFIRRAFDEKAAQDLLLPLRSFAAIVSMFEVRHRSRPEVLDSQKVSLLLRNLLLTIYHGLHKRVVKCDDNNDEFNDNLLLRLVFEVVKSENPREEFHSIVKKVIQLSNRKESSSFIHEFLRRSVIIEDIALNQKTSSNPSELIDWDEVLDKKSLIERFDVNTADFHKISKFKTIKLPKKFISLYLPPFKVDIIDSSIEKAIDLITGQVVSLEKEHGDDKCKFIDDYEKEVYKDGLAMYLILTKEKASSLMFHSAAIGKFWTIDSFYVDQFGDTDHGFNRGLITELSKDNLGNALDKFMSSEITLY